MVAQHALCMVKACLDTGARKAAGLNVVEAWRVHIVSACNVSQHHREA